MEEMELPWVLQATEFEVLGLHKGLHRGPAEQPTSSTLISEAIRHFGFEIVARSGEPAIRSPLRTGATVNWLTIAHEAADRVSTLGAVGSARAAGTGSGIRRIP